MLRGYKIDAKQATTQKEPLIWPRNLALLVLPIVPLVKDVEIIDEYGLGGISDTNHKEVYKSLLHSLMVCLRKGG